MRSKGKSTAPKPFVFVLMPFSDDFKDIYELGIRGAASAAGAYAERVDEQIFTDGILDRIFNQINKSDVIVADMTGRNANVYYEVGYAHALGKITILLTQSSEDIPFDLKHRPHIIYEGIVELKSKLTRSLKWAIAESKKHASLGSSESLKVYMQGRVLPEVGAGRRVVPVLQFGPEEWEFEISLEIRNESSNIFPGSTHLYLMSEEDPIGVPCKTTTSKVRFGRAGYEEESEQEKYVPLRSIPVPEDISSGNLRAQYRLPLTISAIPPFASDQLDLRFQRHWDLTKHGTSLFRLRFHSIQAQYDFDFCLRSTVVGGNP